MLFLLLFTSVGMLWNIIIIIIIIIVIIIDHFAVKLAL